MNEQVPMSPEVARHIATFFDLSSVEIPTRGFLIIRPKSTDIQKLHAIEPVARALTQMTGTTVLIMDKDLEMSSLDEIDMRSLGWVPADA